MNAVVAPTVQQLLNRLAEVEAAISARDTRLWELDSLLAERRALLAQLQRLQTGRP
jgi:flagellar biosynthesis/type III secretory pathway chaperone